MNTVITIPRLPQPHKGYIQRFVRRIVAATAVRRALLAVPILALALFFTGSAHASTVAAATSTDRATVARLAYPIPPQGLPHDWVQRGSGYFRGSDRQDLLHYQVQLNAVAPNAVEFRLEGHDRCLWGKTLVMPDGEGSSWDIHMDPSQGVFDAQNGLWAHQVHNGQRLKLWKAGFLGFYYKVIEIGDLGALQPGTRVVFTWIKDSDTCGA